MKVTPETEPGILILTLNGRFDTFGAGPVQQALDARHAERPRAVLLDMTAVDFLSSAGLRVLLIAAREAEARHGVLALAGLQPYCRDLLRTIRVADALRLFASRQDALAFCRAAAAGPPDSA